MMAAHCRMCPCQEEVDKRHSFPVGIVDVRALDLQLGR